MPDKIITCVEDLDREHGLLLRILHIYSLYLKNEFDITFLKEAAKIFSKFGGEYHGVQEEQYIFPVLKKEKKHVELVDHLIYEHGQSKIIHKDLVNGTVSYAKLDDFIVSYHQHMADEQAIIFPTFKQLVDSKTYKEIGEKFEKNEKKMFTTGFDGVLGRVKSLESVVAAIAHRHYHDDEE